MKRTSLAPGKPPRRRTALRGSRKRLRYATPERRASRRTFREAVFARDRWCRMCGVLGDDERDHPHHIKAKGKGGTDDVDNGARTCPPCHFYITHTAEGIREGRARGLIV